VSGGR